MQSDFIRGDVLQADIEFLGGGRRRGCSLRAPFFFVRARHTHTHTYTHNGRIISLSFRFFCLCPSVPFTFFFSSLNFASCFFHEWTHESMLESTERLASPMETIRLTTGATNLGYGSDVDERIESISEEE